MGSIGGLDVPYGARTQVVRTNVMCVAIADTGLANATTVPKFVLNAYKNAFTGSVLEPDFLYFYEVTDVDGSGYTTAAVADGLFNNDPNNDGTADSTSLDANGILRDIRQVPLKPGSATSDTTAAHAVEGAAHTLADDGDITGNLALEAVLSISAVALDDGAADVDDIGVFTDTDTAGVTTAVETDGLFGSYVQGLAFGTVYNNMLTASATGKNYGNLDADSQSTGARKGPFTLNLASVLEHVDGSGVATGAAAATVDAWTGATAATSPSIGTMAAALTGDAAIISVTSLAKVI